ncbi:MAG: dihydrofolate reductase [Bacteroidales bacterium]|nr:dihydrofolate reductase [Bacteroidales bacterium]
MLPFENLFAIVAADIAGGIGKDNRLPWHISQDLKKFKTLTLNHFIIMGRKTWESLPRKPLPGRKHIVLTRQYIYKEDVLSLGSVEKVLDFVADHVEQLFFVVGGESIYRELLPFCSRIYLTRVFKLFDVDTFFPPLTDTMELKEISSFLYDPISDVYFRFCTYENTRGNKELDH